MDVRPEGRSRLASVEAFEHLPLAALAELERTAKLMPVARGQVLVHQGEATDALYIVVSGRFRVSFEQQPSNIPEIGAGATIGEIAFFAGGVRTATVTAERDSIVLELKRDEFDRLAERNPRIWSTITAQLARRLAATSVNVHKSQVAIPRTIAVCRAGGAIGSDGFLHDCVAGLDVAFAHGRKTIVLDAAAARTALKSGVSLDSSEATEWFNALEACYDHVIYVADPELSEWSKKALRQADLVLCVAPVGQGGSREPNLLELFAERLHALGSLRLILVQSGKPPYAGTRDWLDPRPWIRMHHHIGPARAADFDRLARFVRGQARGLVACGGGAFSSAHIGIFEALAGAGLTFDAYGGTSGGAAMTAGLALDVPPDEIERRTHEMFVSRKAMRKWTWPRYSLLDHCEFDRSLEEHFTAIDIEDLAVPFFAVTTNLTRGETQCLRRGPLWRAVRASAAIPALLPPLFTEQGEMLVDGCLVENVPVRTMLGFKQGPNVVIDFKTPKTDRFMVDNADLPGRLDLIKRMLFSGGARTLPDAPGPHTILLRSLLLNRPDQGADPRPEDVLLAPVIPSHIGHLDWHRHGELRKLARDYASAELARLKTEGHPMLTRAP